MKVYNFYDFDLCVPNESIVIGETISSRSREILIVSELGSRIPDVVLGIEKDFQDLTNLDELEIIKMVCFYAGNNQVFEEYREYLKNIGESYFYSDLFKIGDYPRFLIIPCKDFDSTFSVKNNPFFIVTK